MQVKNLNNGQEFLFVPCHFFFNRYNSPSVLILGGFRLLFEAAGIGKYFILTFLGVLR